MASVAQLGVSLDPSAIVAGNMRVLIGLDRLRILAVAVSSLFVAAGCGDQSATTTGSDDGPDVAPRTSRDVLFVPPPPIDAAAPDVASTRDAALPDASLPDATPGDPWDAARIPVSVEAIVTQLGQPSTVAGLSNRVTCLGLDSEQNRVPGVDARVEVRPSTGWRQRVAGDAGEFDGPGDGAGDRAGESAASVVGVAAGTYFVACVADGLGLRDATAERWHVFPGPPAEVRATVDRHVVEAGEVLTVDCEAFDKEGNAVDAAAAEVRVSPEGAGAEIDGREITLTLTGTYDVQCRLEGARPTATPTVLVLPGRPATVRAALEPARPAYDIGAIVEGVAAVADAYGNLVPDAALDWSADPRVPNFGEGRFRPEAEGRYAVSVVVIDPTHEERPVADEVEMIVDGGGPAIVCERPDPGGQILGTAPVDLAGAIADVVGIRALTVDGRPVDLGDDGRFSIGVEPEWGLNWHDVIARDELDYQNSTFCAYFASDRYLAEDAAVPEAVRLRLDQLAVDDGPPNAPIASLGDLVRIVLESPALIASLDSALRAQNPVVPNACRQRDPFFGACLVRLGAEYRGMSIGGPNDISLELVNGGLRVSALFRDVTIDARLLGDFSNDGRLHTDAIHASILFGLELAGAQPVVSVNRVERLELAPIDADFSGAISGFLLELVFGAFERTIRDTVTIALRDFLVDNVDGLLSDVLSGLDIGSLGGEFAFPSLGDGPVIHVGLGFAFSSVEARPDALVIGLATTVQGPRNEAGRSFGVPAPPGPALAQLDGASPIQASIGLAFLNQVLHRLWRGGAFALDLAPGGGAEEPGDPEAVDVLLRVTLPPAVVGTGVGNDVRLFLGPAVGTLAYPGLLEAPIRIELVATALAGVELTADGTLRFGAAEGVGLDAPDGVAVESLAVRFDGAVLSHQARATLERTLRRVLQRLVDETLNAALPSLPVPDFELPDSLAEFGVPAGARIGLRGATLETRPAHWILEGGFGP